MPDFNMIKLSLTNCYLLKATKGYMLIDCGNRHDKLSLLGQIRNLGATASAIRCLLLTHHHSDHCGLLKLLTDVNPDIQVIMSRKCSEYLTSGKNCKPAGEHYANRAMGFFIDTYSKIDKNWSENFTPYRTRMQDIIIDADDNSILPELGLEGSIIMTPGHTEDSISMVSGNSAFVGDAARNMLNFTGKPYQPILLSSTEACLESWRKLAAFNIKIIYPAHGRPFDIKKLKIKS